MNASPAAAAAARGALIRLDSRIDDELLADLRLLVSELVTNSVRHSGAGERSRVGLEVSVVDTGLRVEVTDAGSGFQPRPRGTEESTPGGWGLYLVDRLADRWGVERDSPSCVWFEVDL